MDTIVRQRNRGLASLFVVFQTILGCGDAPPPAPVQLVETTGTVLLNGRAATAQPASAQPLNDGDQLEVATGGLARVVFPDGSRVELGAGAIVLTQMPAGASDVALKLLDGTTEFHVRGATTYQLHALNTTTTVREAAGQITTSAGLDLVAMSAGTARVLSIAGGAVTELAAPRTVEVTAGGKPPRLREASSPAR